MIESIHHAVAIVSNIERSIAFYRDILGLKLINIMTESGKECTRGVGLKQNDCFIKEAMFEFEGTHFALMEYVNPRGKSLDRTANTDPGEIHIAFRVSNIGEMYKKLKEKGVKFASPILEVMDGPLKGWLWVYFNDPDGAQLELVEEPTHPPLPLPPTVRWEKVPAPKQRFVTV